MDFKKYEQDFKKRKTSALIKGYSKYNADFRRIARSEFRKRRVPTRMLPYTVPKKRQQPMGFRFGGL